MNKISRREFIKSAGYTTLSLIAFESFINKAHGILPQLSLPTVPPQSTDNVILAKGLSHDILIKWDDPISSLEKFGISNDFISIQKIPHTKEEYYMWVNHEYPLPYLIHGKTNLDKKSRSEVDQEQEAVGGSILHLKKVNSKWVVVKNSPINKRINAKTKIPFSNNTKINGSSYAIGTFANCAGGKTSWGTFLSCEENYSDYYGKEQLYGWTQAHDYPVEHYGWVVEINPQTQSTKKLIPLGRFEHECATTTLAPDGRTVVYMGDDASDEHIYKFISDKKGSLDSGTLYVADTDKGVWKELTHKNPLLKNKFKSQLDILINTRDAAKIVGATPHDRPEDVEILNDNTVLVACTNSTTKIAPHGYILAIEEKNKNPLSLEFKSYKWLECGDEAGISCPDNFALDKKGNLWVTSDISEKLMGSFPYKKRKNNGLFYIPTSGSLKGVVHQVASAPIDAEFTGPCFSEDFETLFLSVQHPGAKSSSKGYTSHWPNQKSGKPLSAVIAISGSLLKHLQS